MHVPDNDPRPIRQTPLLTIVLPVHNEAPRLADVVRELADGLARHSIATELIVVDDGSGDGSHAVIRELMGEVPGLRLFRHQENRGYGAALATGFAQSQGKWVCAFDADGQMVPDDLPRLLDAARLSKARVVLGYRRRRADPFLRVVNAQIWRLAVGALLSVWVRDVDCPLKMIQGDLLRSLALHCRGAGIGAELLLHLRLQGERWHELPVRHRARPSGRPTGARLPVIVTAIRELALLAATRRRLRIHWKEASTSP